MRSDSWKHENWSAGGKEAAWAEDILEKIPESDGRTCSAKVVSALKGILQAPGILLVFSSVQVDH